MSRVGKKPIVLPSNVKVIVQGQKISVEGPQGKLQMEAHPRVSVKVDNGQVLVSRPSNAPSDRALHGLTRSLINNMVKGTVDGYMKELEIEGVGFRASMKGKSINFALGFSHPIDFPIPEGIKVEIPKPERVIIKGIDKYLVGQVAANIRKLYEPEPYKGKGIRYKGEQIRRKQGKTVG
jgi:large subunit ribosomal protein L6